MVGSEHNPSTPIYSKSNRERFRARNILFDGFRCVDDETPVSIAVKITINNKKQCMKTFYKNSSYTFEYLRTYTRIRIV